MKIFKIIPHTMFGEPIWKVYKRRFFHWECIGYAETIEKLDEIVNHLSIDDKIIYSK